MKTKSFTKIMFAVAGSLLAIGSMQAQSVNKDSLTSLNKNAIQAICPGQGHAAGSSGFWGYAFGDYSYLSHGDSAGRGTKQWGKGLGSYGTGQNTNPNAFEIRRAYLGYDYKINDKFGAYALLAYEGDQDVNDNRTVYLKYMYFKWKGIFKGSDLKVGQQATSSFASDYNTEPLMGYRAIEKTIMDIHGMDGSSDMGINLGGKLWTNKPADDSKVPTFIGYNLMVGNNSGNNPVAGFTGNATSLAGATTTTSNTYTTTVTVPLTSQKTGKDTTINGISNVQNVVSKTTSTTSVKQTLNPFNNTTDEAKKFRVQLFVNTLNNALTIGGYVDYINYGDKFYGTATGYQASVMTEKAYLVYNSKWFGLGGEFVMQTYKNGEIESTYNDGTGKVTTDTTDASEQGMSVFARGTIIPNRLSIFVRYDMYTPDTKFSTTADTKSTLKVNGEPVNETFTSNASNLAGNTYKENFLSAGLDWAPTKDQKVHIMPNVWYYQIKNGVGSDKLAGDNYLFMRLTFLFAFN